MDKYERGFEAGKVAALVPLRECGVTPDELQTVAEVLRSRGYCYAGGVCGTIATALRKALNPQRTVKSSHSEGTVSREDVRKAIDD